jgi:hypothetical protein
MPTAFDLQSLVDWEDPGSSEISLKRKRSPGAELMRSYVCIGLQRRVPRTWRLLSKAANSPS